VSSGHDYNQSYMTPLGTGGDRKEMERDVELIRTSLKLGFDSVSPGN
jgi:hypothetical protein